jgi:hypothetical protein
MADGLVYNDSIIKCSNGTGDGEVVQSQADRAFITNDLDESVVFDEPAARELESSFGIVSD